MSRPVPFLSLLLLGSLSFPFCSSWEEALWKEEAWGLALLADTIDPSLFDWAMDKENSKHRRWKEATKTLLSSVERETYQPYTIPVVPDELRKSNEHAYMPKVISIGPRYRGRRDLLPMEEVKWHYMRSLLNRAPDPSGRFVREMDYPSARLNRCMEAILRLDAAVRASYVDEIKLDRYDLATVMLLDGCFLLELLISVSAELDSELQSSEPHPNSIEEMGKMEQVLSDLTLLENQIPLFILITLFGKLYVQDHTSHQRRITALALRLFGFYPDLRVDLGLDGSHFPEIASWYTHLLYKERNAFAFVVDISGGEEATPGSCVEHLNRCATRLEAAGILIKPVSNDNYTPGVAPFKSSIKFSYSEGLELPRLNITQVTEGRWRNFIAWEHHKKNTTKGPSSIVDRCCLFTSSAFLFRDLICCASDVQLLKDRGVIVDDLNMSNRDLVAFFRSITSGVDRGSIDPIHRNTFHALNTYAATNHVTRIPILLYHYFGLFLEWMYNFHNFLRRGYNFAATMITVLTVVQTAYAILAYHFPKN